MQIVRANNILSPKGENDLPTTIALAAARGIAFAEFNGNVWDVKLYGQKGNPEDWLAFRRGSGWDPVPDDETMVPEGRWMPGYEPAADLKL